MAKIKIYFKGEQYEIEESTLASSFATLTQTLTTLSGGAVTPDEPDTPDTPVEPDEPTRTFSIILRDYDTGNYVMTIDGVSEGMTWKQLADKHEDYMYAPSEEELYQEIVIYTDWFDNGYETGWVLDDNGSYLSPQEVVEEGRVYKLVGYPIT